MTHDASYIDTSDQLAISMDATQSVRNILGWIGPAVLLPAPPGCKGSREAGWNRKSLADMADPAHLATFREDSNISVLLGQASQGLCSIDFDNDEAAGRFLELNPRFAITLRTKGSRGCNFWVRMTGQYPRLCNLTIKDSRPKVQVGEWRSDGAQTMIWGTHPSGCSYEWIVAAEPITITFEDIQWPDEWEAPKRVTSIPTGCADAELSTDTIITLPSHSTTITECSEKLFSRIGQTETLFSRGGSIVEIDARKDGLALRMVSPQAFRSRMEQFGNCVVWRKGSNGELVLKPNPPTLDQSSALIESLAAQRLLPTIRGVVNCPVLTADGTEVCIVSEGYDRRTEIVVSCGGTPPTVTIEEAVDYLKSLLAEFDFQTPGDRSRAIAALVSPGLKFGGHLKGRVPADVAEADQSQAGKTFRQKLVAAVYRETPTLVTQKKGGVGSDDESFNEALIKGRPFIIFDNRRGRFDSAHVEAFLTAPGLFSVRVPYKGSAEVDPSWFIVGLTSNGVETTPDLANRSSIVRIRKRVGYAFKSYPEGGLMEHVTTHQSYYLGCVFSVIIAWLEAGKPRTDDTRHDFREWCQVLDWIVQNIFHEAPLMDGHESAQDRVSNPALTFVRNIAIAIDQSEKLGERLNASQIFDLAQDNGIELPNLQTQTTEAGAKQIGTLFAKVFKTGDSAQVDCYVIERSERKAMRKDGNGFYPMKIYTFTK